MGRLQFPEGLASLKQFGGGGGYVSHKGKTETTIFNPIGRTTHGPAVGESCSQSLKMTQSLP